LAKWRSANGMGVSLGKRRLKSDPWVEGKDGSSKLGHFK